MQQKKKNPLLILIQILYPPIIYILISFTVESLFIMCYSSAVMMGYSSSTNDVEAMTKFIQSDEMLNQVLKLVQENMMLISLSTAFVCIPLFYFLYRGDQKKRSRHWQKVSGWYPWMLLLVLGVSSCIALNDWISVSGLMNIFSGYEEVAEQLYGGSFTIEFLAIGIAAPIVEELIFRGLMFRRMRDVTKASTAIIFSALFFGIIHMNVVQGLYAFLIGILLAFVYESFGTLWAPIAFHAIANIASVLITEILQPGFSQTFLGVMTEMLLTTALMLVSFYGIVVHIKDVRNRTRG